MGLYNTLEEAGYTNIVQTETVRSWDTALKFTLHRQPIITSARFYAKKGGKSFKVTLERVYKNRTSGELLRSYIKSVSEVPDSEYNAETAKIGPLHMHKPY